MATFTDGQEREWSITLDGPKITTIRQDCDPDFLRNDFTQEQNTFARLAGDPVLLCRCIFLLTEKQRVERGIDEEAFYKGVVGEAIDRATDALMTAIVDFCPARTKDALQAFVQQDKMQQEAMKRIVAKANDPKLMEEALNRMEAEVDAAMKKILTPPASVTDSPASAESTPPA